MEARGNGREPLRTCVGCRRVRPKPELVRLVLVDGRVVADETGRAPGRGAYVCRDTTCVGRAAPRLGHALRGTVSAGEVRRLKQQTIEELAGSI